MLEYLDTLILHFGWFVARNLDAVMLVLWWVLPTVSAATFLLMQMRHRLQWRPRAAFISFGFVPFLVLLGIALVTPFAAQSYSVDGLFVALIYLLGWVGVFHTIGFALSAIWTRKALATSRTLLVLVVLQLCGAWWVEQVAREHHSGPFFQSGG